MRIPKSKCWRIRVHGTEDSPETTVHVNAPTRLFARLNAIWDHNLHGRRLSVSVESAQRLNKREESK